MAVICNGLKLQRTRRGMTQEQVAAAVGVSRQAVAKWERGESLPDIESCIRLADLYGVPLDKLVRSLREEEKTPDGRQMFGCVRMNDKGQITLPQQVREAFHMEPGCMVLVLADTDRGIALIKMGDLETATAIPRDEAGEGAAHEGH